MFFEYPKLLWLLVVPVLMVAHYIYLEFAQRHPHLRVSTSIPWLVKKTSAATSLRHIPFICRIIALILIVIAMARPRSADIVEKIDKQGYDWIKSELGIEIQKEVAMNTVSIGTCATKALKK